MLGIKSEIKTAHGYYLVSNYLNSGLSMDNSCSMLEKIITISVMISGQRKVTWTADMRSRITRKQRNTAVCTSGETGTERRHSESLSVMSGICLWYWSTSEQKITQASLLSSRARCSCSNSLLLNRLIPVNNFSKLKSIIFYFITLPDSRRLTKICYFS